jgi:hypothetical protein
VKHRAVAVKQTLQDHIGKEFQDHKSPATAIGQIQPSKAARANALGMIAATHGPIYGIKRKTAARKP